MADRKPLSERIATEVLVASRRRCCLCFYLLSKNTVCRGQIAHLNRKRDDDRFENLVWLCFDHHDEFDSRTSQSKGLLPTEVRHYRDRLIEELRQTDPPPAYETAQAAKEVVAEEKPRPWRHAWRFPLWLVADQPALFAYSAPGADGVCAIERVNLPDGRIVIACVQTVGNPGKSITNGAEYVFEQVCERFELPRDKIVWLENYDFFERDVWREVRFSLNGEASDPKWTVMTPELWEALGLSPKKRLSHTPSGELKSKLRKRFRWPPPMMALGLDD